MSSIMGTASSDAARASPRQAEGRQGDGAETHGIEERVTPGVAEEEGVSLEEERSQDTPAPSSKTTGAQEAEEDEVEDEEEEEERAPSRPRRVTRNRILILEESETDSDRGAKRRGRPPKNPSAKASAPTTTTTTTTTPPSSTEKPKRQRGKPRGRNGPEDRSGGGDSPGDYVPVEVGDCVLLDSGDADDHYVALVSSVQLSQSSDKPTGFTAQWYYKPDDIRDDVRETIPGGVLPNEVFLSPHKDKNSVDAVIGLCNVVPPEEYIEVQSEIDRGFREKGNKPYYVCRFKYYPSRSVRKALEPLKEQDIRGGLGPQKPKVGENHQATIPELLGDAPRAGSEHDRLPWRLTAPAAPDKSLQVWSRHAVATQEPVFRQFRLLLDTIRFGVGNVVRVYRTSDTIQGHVHCLVLKFVPTEAIDVCLSTGQVKSTLKSELCSPLSEDAALKILYASRFNLTHAALQCSQRLLKTQRRERDAFKQEVVIFAQVATQEKARHAAAAAKALADASNRKRRK